MKQDTIAQWTVFLLNVLLLHATFSVRGRQILALRSSLRSALPRIGNEGKNNATDGTRSKKSSSLDEYENDESRHDKAHKRVDRAMLERTNDARAEREPEEKSDSRRYLFSPRDRVSVGKSWTWLKDKLVARTRLDSMSESGAKNEAISEDSSSLGEKNRREESKQEKTIREDAKVEDVKLRLRSIVKREAGVARWLNRRRGERRVKMERGERETRR